MEYLEQPRSDRWQSCCGTPVGSELDVTGLCPRCLHRTSASFGNGFSSALPDSTSDHEQIVWCACGQDHPNRPAAKTGCGAYWYGSRNDAK